ncbi:MAG: sugar ABC transporter permease [SAR324 cluster bacterium]|nr:sugar ABC transporter permease [SAR324 cluster bacterium]
MMKYKREEIVYALVLIAPFILAYTLFLIYPTIYQITLSFQKAPLVGTGEWIGLENYSKLINDKLFWKALSNTGVFVLWTVVPNTLLGLMFAMMVIRHRPIFQAVILACFFIPHILPVTVVTEMWTWLLSKQFGIIQEILDAFDTKRINFFTSRYWAMPMVAFITIWWTIGFNIVLFIAGLRNINPEIYEASEMEGASRIKQFRYITWPLIWPVTALVLTLQLIFQMKIFDQMYLLTGGGPFNSTLVVLQLVYNKAFQNNDGGYAAAISLVLFGIILMTSILQYQVLKKQED